MFLSKTTRLQFVSDLHLELNQQYAQFEIIPTAKILILAGDIGRLIDYEPLKGFLERHAKIFEHVIFILGNHEFYGMTKDQGLSVASTLSRSGILQQKLVILNRKRVDLTPGLTILGCTLHSYIPPEAADAVTSRVKDFTRIVNWDVKKHNAEHEADLQWLRAELQILSREQSRKRVVIVTHYAPSLSGTTKPEHVNNAINSAFCTDILQSQLPFWNVKTTMIKAWIFGHTHFSTETKINSIRLLSNQRGYVFGQVAPAAPQSKMSLFKFWKRPTVAFDSMKHFTT